jgi:hypothetical protein
MEKSYSLFSFSKNININIMLINLYLTDYTNPDTNQNIIIRRNDYRYHLLPWFLRTFELLIINTLISNPDVKDVLETTIQILNISKMINTCNGSINNYWIWGEKVNISHTYFMLYVKYIVQNNYITDEIQKIICDITDLYLSICKIPDGRQKVYKYFKLKKDDKLSCINIQRVANMKNDIEKIEKIEKINIKLPIKTENIIKNISKYLNI